MPTIKEAAWFRGHAKNPVGPAFVATAQASEFYGNEMPSWDELSEGAKDTLSRVYDLILRGHYEKERGHRMGRKSQGASGITGNHTLEVLYYLDRAKKHTPIEPLDTMIAAHAVSMGATLVTNNTREFQRVPDLEVEDWTGA